MLDKSIRELDRERNNLQSQEKKLIADIKKMAKQNQMGAVKVRAPHILFFSKFLRGLPTCPSRAAPKISSSPPPPPPTLPRQHGKHPPPLPHSHLSTLNAHLTR
jgi:hypothetical protein